jgi:ElaB/YqjD/DUF883 family membrane-anchored ribosome-binding protein
MDRNDFASEGSTSGQAGGAGAEFGNTGNTSGAQGYGAGSTANVGQGFSSSGSGDMETGGQGQGLADRARDIAGSAQDKLADVGSTVRDRAGTLKNSLADALETGADKLRQRGQATGGTSGQLAGATSSGGLAVEGDGRVAQVTDRVAGGMEATADWLREADLDSVRSGIERQVQEHPGRTLLIAVGLGYLLGKAFRK